jgi:hypothetical protein
MNIEDKGTSSNVSETNEYFRREDGANNVTKGPEYQEYEDGHKTTYDADTYTNRSSYDYDETVDITEYRLGLGYQVTENLTFDLMFKETDSDGYNGDPDGRGGVDARTVWGSVVLAF